MKNSEGADQGKLNRIRRLECDNMQLHRSQQFSIKKMHSTVKMRFYSTWKLQFEHCRNKAKHWYRYKKRFLWKLHKIYSFSTNFKFSHSFLIHSCTHISIQKFFKILNIITQKISNNLNRDVENQINSQRKLIQN